MTVKYLQTQAEVNELAAYWAANPPKELAFDLEGDSHKHRYGFHLCLLQFYDGLTFYLVDTVTAPDLTPLRPILESRDTIKVMYATDFDVRLFSHVCGWRFRGFFDVQIAAKLLGLEKIGMEFLVETQLQGEFKKSKRWQSSDWTRRPLHPQQIEYAAADVVHLLPLKHILEPQLIKANLWEEFMRRNRDAEEYTFKQKFRPWLNLKGARLMAREQKILLKHLFGAREEIAKQLNYPAYWVMSDENLLLLLDNLTFTEEEVPGLSPKCKALAPLFTKYLGRARKELEKAIFINPKPARRPPRPKA